MFRRIGSIVLKELIQLGRDWLFVLMIVLGPVSELSAIAYATGTEIKNLPMAVTDYDRSPESRALVRSLSNVETFNVTHEQVAESEIPALLDQGDIIVAVIVPPDFGAELDCTTRCPQVQVLLNGAESAAASKALASVEGVVARYGADMLLREAGFQSAGNLEPSARVWFNEELREANFTLPAELGFMLYVVTMWAAALGIARERELGTLEQLLVMPISKFELLIGKSVPAILIGYTNFLLMLVMTVVVYKVPMRGSLPLLLGLAFVYVLVELQRGLLVSVLSRTQQQALLIVFLLAFIDMTFAGYAVPVESMPRTLQTISNIFPIRHWMIIMRGIMLKGTDLSVFWPHMLAILGLGVILTGLTLLSFRQALKEV